MEGLQHYTYPEGETAVASARAIYGPSPLTLSYPKSWETSWSPG